MGHLLGIITPLLFKCLMDIMSQQVKLHGSVDFLFPSVPKSIQTSFESPFIYCLEEEISKHYSPGSVFF